LLPVALAGCGNPNGEGPAAPPKAVPGSAAVPAPGAVVDRFAGSSEGAGINVNLIPMGSPEAAQAIR
jgi:hypothetical protein